jgi:hypothetical protein
MPSSSGRAESTIREASIHRVGGSGRISEIAIIVKKMQGCTIDDLLGSLALLQGRAGV